ncbi:MAG: hypothetical protein Q8P24_13010 [Desulfobacterales bacterium]|nr:hypothetical protein [Desulfobacterales bacterium]
MAIRLNRREKRLIYLISGLIFFFLFIETGVFPFIDNHKRLSRTLQVKSQTLQEMKILKAQYDALNNQAGVSKARLARREKSFTLFAFLDKLVGEAGIKNKITYMKPSSSAIKNSPYKISIVEMKLQAVTLVELTNYLYRIETSENFVSVKRISISKLGQQDTSVNAVLQVETMEI